jgi:hypothetical protein
MDDITALLRSKELEPTRGSATIDTAAAYPLRVRHMHLPAEEPTGE